MSSPHLRAVAAGLSALVVALQVPAGAAPLVRLRPGMVISTSIVVRPGTYRLPSAGLEQPAIVVRGTGITVDFNGAELRGGSPDADPDSFTGLGILVDGGEEVTIRNARLHGYKVGLLARQASRFHLTQSDLSYNWKQRLYSLVEHESLLDWMSYHQNDSHEWLRYGAAVYLDSCRDCEIDHVTAVQGQNGLMMTRSEGAKVWNNTFSYLSGIGIGMYRSSRNSVMHNRIDWCVRGYSHGFYNRGQDSAGILMYEQSSHNTVAYNSATHGGDGLFLWAGQTTMDTGRGGCNDNVFVGNDFSHAPANGIEATFSRNRFYGNRIEENWHGVWGGYSYDSDFAENRFRNNDEAIAIEHGQYNAIVANRFENDRVAIRLWANESQDPSWQYPKYHDTRSIGYYIAGNTFTGVGTVLKHERTENVVVSETVDLTRVRARPHVEPLADGMDAMIPPAGRRGRRHIIVDEWGPYDFRAPKLWPEGRSDALPLKLRVLGPEGTWKAARVRGATLAPPTGRVGDVVTITPAWPREGAPAVDFEVRLEYRGGDVVDARGRHTPAGKPFVFGYARYFVPVDWTVRFFEFDERSDPLAAPDGFAALLAGAPLKTARVDRLDYMSGGAVTDGVPRDRVALSAAGVVSLSEPHELLVISDDGVRIWAGDRLLLDRWNDHESIADRVKLDRGRHDLRLEYYDRAGFAELRVQLLR